MRDDDTRPGRLDERSRTLTDTLLDRRLTVQRVLLIFVFGGGVVVLWALYDVRTQWAPFLWTSPALMVGLLVGLVLIAGGAAVQSLQRQHQSANQSLLGLMQDQAKDLRREIGESRLELATMRREALAERQEHSRQMSAVLVELSDVKAAEAACKARVEEMQRNIGHLAKRRDDRTLG